jgi:hypothetical protein
MSEQRPHFLFVCDHGIRGDHSRCDHSIGCREADRVASLPWFPDRPGWWAAEGVDEDSIDIWPMEGGERGHDLARMVQGWSTSEDHDRRVKEWYTARGLVEPDDPRRWAIEIRCLAEHCTTFAYRSDGDMLQALLMKITSDDNPCGECGLPFAVTVSADEKLIVMKLQGSHLARGHAKKHYGLQV